MKEAKQTANKARNAIDELLDRIQELIDANNELENELDTARTHIEYLEEQLNQ